MKASIKGRTELAQLYLPNLTPEAAWAKMKRWIRGCPPLASALHDAGYNPSRRFFYPEEIKIISYYLGEP